MDFTEIDKKISLAKNGDEKIYYIKQAIALADDNNDYSRRIVYRLDLNSELSFYTDKMDLFIVYPTALQINDNLIEETGYSKHTFRVLWQYKWLLENAYQFNQITKEQFNLLFEDAKKRYIANNYSIRPLYQYKYRFYENIDMEISNEAYKKYLSLIRDRMSDCHACELSSEIQYLLANDKLDMALHKAIPLFEGELTCSEQPENTYGDFIRYYNEKIANGFCEYIPQATLFREKLKKIIKEKGLAQMYIPDILLNYALTEPEKALKYFIENWNFYETTQNPTSKYYFSIGVLRLFNTLGEKETYKMNISSEFPLYNKDNTYNLSLLKDYYKKTALDIANKIDIRNGNNIYKDRLNILSTICNLT